MHPGLNKKNKQQGSTLMVSLLCVVLIMVLGVAAMNSSTIQSKLAGNLQFESAALNSAEFATVAGEQWLSSSNNHTNSGFTTYSGATPYLHPTGHLASTYLMATTTPWDNTMSMTAGTNGRYVIEKLATNQKLPGTGLGKGGLPSTGCTTIDLFQITSRGEAARGSEVFTQTIYSVLTC